MDQGIGSQGKDLSVEQIVYTFSLVLASNGCLERQRSDVLSKMILIFKSMQSN